jgi:large subunit ribosomal protein L25
MEEILLNVAVREETGKQKAKKARREGFIPGVIYGEGKQPVAVSITTKDLIHLVHTRGSENTIVSVQVDGQAGGKSRHCLIKDMQYDPVVGNIIHVDLNEISLTKVIKVEVPVNAKGEPVGVKQDGGSLDHIMWKLEVECLPTNIPKSFDVDVSQLKIGDSIHVRDIQFPSGVKCLNDVDATVLSVSAPVQEVAPAEVVEGEESKEPEVIKEKKEVPAEGKEEEKK